MASGSDNDNLTGVWAGLYTYAAEIRKPVHYTAELTESGGWITGRTEEIASVGPRRGQPITATIQGRRSGRTVTFLKAYDMVAGGYDAVRYEGDLNNDATEIEGRWSIPGNWSGKFLMTRSGGADIALERDVAAKI
jgi:hypothetical protein